MTDVFWFTIEWPVWLFGIAMVLCVIVMVKIGLALGFLLLAWVLYVGMMWNPWWDWIPNVFWLAFLAGLGGIVWGLLNGGGRTLAVWGSGVSLILAVLLVNSNLFGVSPPFDRENPGLTGKLEQLEEENNNLVERQDGFQEELTWLDRRITELEAQLPGK